MEARASDSDDVIPLLGNWKSVKYTLSSGVGAWSTKEADRLTAKEFQFSEVELRMNGKTQCKDPKYKVSQIELEDFVDPDQAIPSGCGVLPASGSLKLVEIECQAKERLPFRFVFLSKDEVIGMADDLKLCLKR